MELNQDTSTLQFSSPAFAEKAEIPPLFTCKGENVSPPLQIGSPPLETKSFALVMHDPDAVGNDWVHWLVWNIPSGTSEIKQASLPEGAVAGMTSFSKTGYGGPCPPKGTGTHRYIFELFALDTEEIELSPQATREQLTAAMQDRIISHTTLTGIVKAQD